MATHPALGESALLVADLQAMVAEEPLREERWRLLVLALYRAHRQADALGALRRARTTLADELGVDPGPALRELEQQVLVEVRHLGGAYAREGVHPSAFSHRAARFSVLTVGMAMDEASGAASLAHAHRVFMALGDWDTGGVWPNFGIPHDAVSARRSYDEPTLARLREVVATYDPDGVLQAGAYTRAIA